MVLICVIASFARQAVMERLGPSVKELRIRGIPMTEHELDMLFRASFSLLVSFFKFPKVVPSSVEKRSRFSRSRKTELLKD